MLLPILRLVGDAEHRPDKSSLPKQRKTSSLELIHEQLPLPVPCYDLLPVIELTVDPRKAGLRAFPTPLS